MGSVWLAGDCQLMLRNCESRESDVLSEDVSAVTWKLSRELTSSILPPLLSI